MEKYLQEFEKDLELKKLDDISTLEIKFWQCEDRDEDLAKKFGKTLVQLLQKSNNIDLIKKIVTSLKKLYQDYLKNENIALLYSFGLVNLSVNQLDIESIKATISQLGKLHASFPTSEAIGIRYAFGLVNLLNAQKDLESIEETFSNLAMVEKNFQSKFIVEIYSELLFLILESRNDLYEFIKTKLKDIFSNHPDQIINDYFNFISDYGELTDEHYSLAKGFLSDKDKTLTEYYSRIRSDFNELENEKTQKDFILLLKLIYDIKQILLIDTVKDDIEAFGHYTSLQALGFMLAMNEIEQDGQRQKLKNSETYSRLSHVLHMNDPKEGKMLDEYLGISDHNFKKSDADLTSSVTPWFLMSLTTNLDNLAMWSQYGDNAKGVCIAFKKESFKLQKPANFSDMSFKSYESTLQKDENDADCSKFEIKEFDDEKDYLYKVAYITTKGSQSAIKILETDLIKEKDADNISKSLKDIKKIFSKNEKNNDVIKIFSKHLDEVRYLFKSSDYAYESELRLLKYVDFSNREKIKINATKDSLPKLYVQRKSPIALNKIIFGPKLVEVEDLLPYIYLYDKNIECTRSSIDFR